MLFSVDCVIGSPDELATPTVSQVLEMVTGASAERIFGIISDSYSLIEAAEQHKMELNTESW